MKEKDIDNVENYIRLQLPEILLNAATRNEMELDITEKTLIFGERFATNPDKFSFTPGERILINQIVEHVNIKKRQQNDYFAIKVRKMSIKKVIDTSVGKVFANRQSSTSKIDSLSDTNLNMKTKRETAKRSQTTVSNSAIQEKLVQRAKEVVAEFAPMYEFTENSTQVDLSDPDKIKGKVQCIFCNHFKLVHWKRSESSQNWVMSNLKSHLRICSKKGNDKMDVTTVKLDIEPVSAMNDDANDNPEDYSSSLSKQMYIQNIKMTNSITQNGENKAECEIALHSQESTRKIGICEMPKDGNCMFHAISHQLYRCKIGSPNHNETSIKLRMDVVDHIKNNTAMFTNAIKGRIYEIDPTRKIINLQEEINFFLVHHLGRDRYFGGSETLQACSNMFRINIVIFNEKDEANMSPYFNPEFQDTIMIAFRLFANNSKEKFCNLDRNHYDSVVTLDNNIISGCSRDLIQRHIRKQIRFGESTVESIEIDD